MPKICVYAICKNESRHINRWMDSMSEADEIYVLDTGSEDDSVDLLSRRGAHVVSEEIIPWRFDSARNRALELVPDDADLCVCTDLDEVFHSGWRSAMEAALTHETTQLCYRYTWNFRTDGSEGTVFRIEKAHRRHGFCWINPVHEVLDYFGAEPRCLRFAPGVQLDHHADETKPRTQYLPLLELAVRENPLNDRNMHYLGREYMFRRMWPECEKTLLRHLSLPGAVWHDERCASMRYLACAVSAQGRDEEAEGWLLRAAAEAPHLREPWLEASQFAARHRRWAGSLYYALRALEITHRSENYISEADSWGPLPYDLAAVAAYNLNLYDEALRYGEEAYTLAPKDARLSSNLVCYRKAAGSTHK